jgi:hypothetical protein
VRFIYNRNESDRSKRTVRERTVAATIDVESMGAKSRLDGGNILGVVLCVASQCQRSTSLSQSEPISPSKKISLLPNASTDCNKKSRRCGLYFHQYQEGRRL